VAVLSGGGAKAAAHVGALKALAERGVQVSHYVATSMGAVVAAAFASGLGYDRVMRRLMRIRRRDVAMLSPGGLLGPLGKSFLQDGPLKRTIAKLVPAGRFAELETGLTVTAVDGETGELVLFGDGGNDDVPLGDALYASCALPVFYPPAEIFGRRYVDGGMRAVLPLDTAGAFDPELVFASYVGPTLAGASPDEGPRVPPMLRAHSESLRILMATQANEAIARARAGRLPMVLVRPALAQLATFATDRMTEFVEQGYRAATKALRDVVLPGEQQKEGNGEAGTDVAPPTG
jgi:NTE family protein